MKSKINTYLDVDLRAPEALIKLGDGHNLIRSDEVLR